MAQIKITNAELKMYLGTDLKGLDSLGALVELVGIKNETYFIKGLSSQYAYGDIQEFKPLLRPLSDLTKEIEVNGEKFVPLDWFDKNYAPLSCSHEEMKEHFMKETLTVMPFVVIQKLIEWHFDVFGLIEKGLAINLNELK